MPKGKKADVDQLSLNLPDLPYTEPEPSDAGGAVSAEALAARIDGMSKQIDDLVATNQRLQQTNMTLLATQPGAASVDPQNVPNVPVPKGVDLDNMPDQYTQPKEYTTELNRRIQAAIDSGIDSRHAARSAMENAQVSSQKQVEGLWEQFRKDYPDLAKNQDFVEVVATKVAADARERGVDLKRYMFTTRDQFLSDVAEGVKTRFGKALELETASDDDEDDGSRTAGIQGGGAAIKTGGQNPKSADDDPGDFVKELQEAQRATGMF